YTLIELIATIMIVAIIGAMCVGGLQSCSSSTGSRVGQIVKLSNKGLVAKTWEGDLTTGGLTANGVNVWHFSVSDEQLIPALQSAMDQNRTVKLAYSQKMFRSPLTGDTSYFVTSVTVITNK
ncbi:MAG: hypothetical protein EBU46_17260, partial [Nitrosomonadaceae bacterium]|nr:hypothetical protein [Nitrosomonadaceae bacterium]